MSFNISVLKSALADAGHAVSKAEGLIGSDLKELFAFAHFKFGLSPSQVSYGLAYPDTLTPTFPGHPSAVAAPIATPTPVAAPVEAPTPTPEPVPEAPQAPAVETPAPTPAPTPEPVPEPAVETPAPEHVEEVAPETPAAQEAPVVETPAIEGEHAAS